MRWGHVIIAYVLIGAMMWGGGVIQWSDTGVAGLFVDSPSGDVNEQTGEDLSDAGGPIQQAASTVEGTGLIAIWGLLVRFLGFLFWPIVTLQSVGSPPRVIVLIGVPLTTSFFVATVRLIRGSA